MSERVNGYGPATSPLMIIGDYPTKDDIEKQRPFSGASGEVVRNFFKQSGYSFEKCYRTYYIKQPVVNLGSKNKKIAYEALQSAMAIDDWRKILLEEIEAIKPNVILALGEFPLNYLCEEKNVSKFRGSILPLSPTLRLKIGSERHIRVVPSFMPRYIFLDPSSIAYVGLDYKKALTQLNKTKEIEELGNVWIARSADALIEYWKRAKHGQFMVTDIETVFNFPVCASICTDGIEAVSFPLLDLSRPRFENYCTWIKYAEILKSSVPKVNQNMIYDWGVLERVGFQVNNIVGDTMLMANTIYPELPKDLGFLTSIYTDMAYYKDEGREFDPKKDHYDQYLLYNAKDSLSTWKIWKAQQQDAEEMGVKKFYFNFVQPLFFHYKKIDARGIMIDEPKRFKLLDKYYNLLNLHQDELDTAYGQKINVRSPKQVGIFIYEFLNCPIKTHITPLGKEVYSTDEDCLVNLYLNEITSEPIRKILRQIILCRKIESAINLLETPYHYDGRMRTHYHLGGTKNGRTSTSQAMGWFTGIEDGKVVSAKWGTAFQKIPKHGFEFEDQTFGEDIREMFVPTPGYEFFGFDGKNAEGRVVCVLAEDFETLDYIESGNDLHKLTASWIFGKPVQFISKKERDLGKMARHAGNLGQGGAGLSVKVYKSIKYCNGVMKTFHSKAPNVQNIFQHTVEKLVENEKPFFNAFGRRRDFFGMTKMNKHDIFKEAYSFLPQSTVSDHFKQTSFELAEKAPWAYQLVEAHDGLLYEIPKGKRDEFIELTNEVTSRKINFETCTLSRRHELQIPVEMEYSENNWYDMQEIHESVKMEVSV